MGQRKSLKIGWLDEAWFVSAVICHMPASPPLSLLKNGWPVSGNGRQKIEEMQSLIAAHLSQRVTDCAKRAKLNCDGHALFDLLNRDPVITLKAVQALQEKGVTFKPTDLWAFDAHAKLGRILLDRYVSEEWKRQLPLIVASIGGAFTSETASLNATQPRQRLQNELKQGKFRTLSRNPCSTWKELLNHLQGDEIVVGWDDAEIQWRDSQGNSKRTKTQTFKNWK